MNSIILYYLASNQYEPLRQTFGQVDKLVLKPRASITSSQKLDEVAETGPASTGSSSQMDDRPELGQAISDPRDRMGAIDQQDDTKTTELDSSGESTGTSSQSTSDLMTGYAEVDDVADESGQRIDAPRRSVHHSTDLMTAEDARKQYILDARSPTPERPSSAHGVPVEPPRSASSPMTAPRPKPQLLSPLDELPLSLSKEETERITRIFNSKPALPPISRGPSLSELALQRVKQQEEEEAEEQRKRTSKNDD